MSHEVPEFCIYTIVDGSFLEKTCKEGRSMTRTTGQCWVKGYDLWQKAKKENKKMPLLLGDARHCACLLYWGIVKNIHLEAERTRFTVDRVRAFQKKHRPQELVLRRTGKKIAPNYIRCYATCYTPAFLEINIDDKKH